MELGPVKELAKARTKVMGLETRPMLELSLGF